MLQPKYRGWQNGSKTNKQTNKHIYAVYKKPTSDLKIHIDCKWEDRKYIPCKCKSKDSWSRNPHIKQNNCKYAFNIGIPQYVRQTLTDKKVETESNPIIEGDFNNSLTPMDRPPKQKINKETQDLYDTLDQRYLIVNFRTFHPNVEECTFFSSAQGNFSRIDNILSRKSNLSKFKKAEIISSIFSDHNVLKLNINYRKRKTSTWKLNNTFLSNNRLLMKSKGNKKVPRNRV